MRDRVTEQTILEAVARVHDSFGSRDWDDAQEIMSEIAAHASSSAIGRQLSALLA